MAMDMQGEDFMLAPAQGEQDQRPEALITGDLRLYVTEAQAALQPIKGRYSIETVGMQEPLHILWHAEGQVCYRQARVTDIEFDLRGAKAGQTRLYLVAVQVVERGVHGRVLQSGTFVHISVTSDQSSPYEG
jgi:hypothetical protein